MQPNPPSPTASSGKFAAVFAKRTFTPLEDIPPQLTSNMKALRRHIHDGDYGRPLPLRHFDGLSVVEQMEHATPWVMWVRERLGKRLRSGLWSAPNEATFIATNHGDAAPTDVELIAIGWRRHGGRPVQEGNDAANWD
jgi:hypothetical protein